jgi:hypothetical protein
VNVSLEQKLRDNLEAAANGLVVPDPNQAPLPSEKRRWGHGLGFALAGAAAVVALAIPALVLWSGDSRSEGSAPASADPEPARTSESTRPSTTSTTLGRDETTLPAVPRETMAAMTAADHELALVVDRVDDEEPPTATVTLQVTPLGESEPTDEKVVGAPGAFFWFTVTGADAVCDFTAEPTPDGAEVTVEILLSASLGCSEVYVFELNAGELSASPGSPDALARQFVTAWQNGDRETMGELADSEVMDVIADVSSPKEPMFSYCEGAAGSLYCTFEDVDRELVIRVATEPPSAVTEVISVPDQ